MTALLAAAVLAASLSSSTVTGYFESPLAKSANITSREIACGDAANTSNQYARLVDTSSVSTLAGLYAQPAAFIERSLRLAGYDGNATWSDISDARHVRLCSPTWAKSYSVGTGQCFTANLSPTNGYGRYVNYYGVRRVVGLEMFQALAESYFAEMTLPEAAWSSFLPSCNWQFPIASEWISSPPYDWNWTYALPTLDRLTGAPYSEPRTAQVRPLVYSSTGGILTRLGEGQFLGPNYLPACAASAAVRATASWQGYGWTNALVEAGFDATRASNVTARLLAWRTLKSARLDSAAIGCANWCYAVTDESYGEPNRDSITNRHQRVRAQFVADVKTDAATLRLYPDTTYLPRFVSDSDVRISRTGSYQRDPSLGPSHLLDEYVRETDVRASEGWRSMQSSVSFSGSDTNYVGWLVLANANAGGGFDAAILANINPRWQTGLDYHMNTDGAVMTITTAGAGWSGSTWTCSSSDEITLSNRWGVIRITAASTPLHRTVFSDSTSRQYQYRAVGEIDISRTIEATSPMSSMVVQDDTAIGWPTAAMWSTGGAAAMTAYELTAAVVTTNTTPSESAQTRYLYRAGIFTASNRSEAVEARVNATERAITNLVALVGDLGYDALVATDYARMVDAAAACLPAEAAKWDSYTLAVPAIKSGDTMSATYGLLATNGTETASYRTYTATVGMEYDDETQTWGFTVSNRSWDESAASFARWAYVRPNWEEIGGQLCVTNYGGYDVRVRHAHTIKTTFDRTKWSSFTISN